MPTRNRIENPSDPKAKGNCPRNARTIPIPTSTRKKYSANRYIVILFSKSSNPDIFKLYAIIPTSKHIHTLRRKTSLLYSGLPKTPILPKNTEVWYKFNFRAPENFDKTELRFDCRNFLTPELITRLGNLVQLETAIYDPSNVNAFLVARRNQEKLPKPTGQLMPFTNSQGIAYWSWDDGDRSGVDLQTELGTGTWLVKLKYTGTDSSISCNLTRYGYYKDSAHP